MGCGYQKENVAKENARGRGEVGLRKEHALPAAAALRDVVGNVGYDEAAVARG
jgi:hypothetical protein